MLDQNPIYKIYKEGKVPVVRFKDTGFTNFVQDKYFTDYDGNINEKFKNIVGCFCVLGGMQDNFILSGIGNVDTLHIGYVEPDTQVFDVSEGKYRKAIDMFNEALEAFTKQSESVDKSKEIISSQFDDFDIFYTQAIVKAEDITKVGEYTKSERFQFMHTVEDGFFRLNTLADYVFLTNNIENIKKTIEMADKYDAFDSYITIFSEDLPDEIKEMYPIIKIYNEKVKSLYWQERSIFEKLLPKHSTDNINFVKDLDTIFDNTNNTIFFMQAGYSSEIELLINGKTERCRFYVEDGQIILKNKDKMLDINDILTNKDAHINAVSLKARIDALNVLAKYDKDAVVKEPINSRIINLYNFYMSHKLYATDDGFKYYIDDFLIEYHKKLDDCIIRYFHPDYDERLLHEEDIYLNFEDKKFILDVINKYRSIMTDVEKNIQIER